MMRGRDKMNGKEEKCEREMKEEEQGSGVEKLEKEKK